MRAPAMYWIKRPLKTYVCICRCRPPECHQQRRASSGRGRVYRCFQKPCSLGRCVGNLSESPFLLVLDGITDPHNLGACLRTADAMGVHAVIAPKDKSAGLNATVSKVACGAAETVPYITVTNLARTLRELKEYGIWIVGTDMGGDSDLYHCDLPNSVAWVMGNEGEGMRRLTREHCDMLVSIPMFGTVESMNVSVSAGMVLSETRRQRVLKSEK